MAIDLFEIDKSGYDVMERDYAIVVVKNNKLVYGYKINQKCRDDLVRELNQGHLGINDTKGKIDRLRFKIRLHTAIIILLMKEAVKKREILNDCKILICNDIDGHFQEIKEMLFYHIKVDIPNLEKINIIKSKFPKESLVNVSAKAFRERDTSKTNNYIECSFKFEDLKNIIKKRR